jgi:hypothetical protein
MKKIKKKSFLERTAKHKGAQKLKRKTKQYFVKNFTRLKDQAKLKFDYPVNPVFTPKKTERVGGGGVEQ